MKAADAKSGFGDRWKKNYILPTPTPIPPAMTDTCQTSLHYILKTDSQLLSDWLRLKGLICTFDSNDTTGNDKTLCNTVGSRTPLPDRRDPVIFTSFLIKACRGSRVRASLIISLNYSELLTSLRGCFTPGKEPRYPLSRKLDWPQRLSGCCEEEKYICSLPEFEHQPVHLVATRCTDWGYYLHFFIVLLLKTKRLKSFVSPSLYRVVCVSERITRNDKVTEGWRIWKGLRMNCRPGTCQEWLGNTTKTCHDNWWSDSDSRRKRPICKTTCL